MDFYLINQFFKLLYQDGIDIHQNHFHTSQPMQSSTDPSYLHHFHKSLKQLNTPNDYSKCVFVFPVQGIFVMGNCFIYRLVLRLCQKDHRRDNHLRDRPQVFNNFVQTLLSPFLLVWKVRFVSYYSLCRRWASFYLHLQDFHIIHAHFELSKLLNSSKINPDVMHPNQSLVNSSSASLNQDHYSSSSVNLKLDLKVNRSLMGLLCQFLQPYCFVPDLNHTQYFQNTG